MIVSIIYTYVGKLMDGHVHQVFTDTFVMYALSYVFLLSVCLVKFDRYLEEELCDQLVCELRNDNVCKKLLLEDNIAMKLAQSYKSANKNAQQLKGMMPRCRR